MRINSIFSLAICIVLACSGCASLNAPPPIYRVNSNATLELVADFKYWPEMSGYYLPAGNYKAEAEDARGVFFKAPPGMKLLSLTGDTQVEGGIYLAKPGFSGVRGHVYLHMPLLGRQSYVLPDKFFSHYGEKWKIE